MQVTPTTQAELDELISRPTDAVVEAISQCAGRFAVLGAGGKMGFHLSLMLKRACERIGHKEPIAVVSRFGSATTRGLFASAGFDVIPADLSRSENVRQLPPFENVFFLAGVKFGTTHDPDLLQRMNVEMPGTVADRFRDSRIVALSTGCVYSFTTPDSGGSTEESETNPPGEYAHSCQGREEAFNRAAREFGTRSSLIRLNYSIDLRYGVLVDIARDVLAERPINVETGYVNVIWQGDAIAYILQTLPHVSAPPLILNVTGEEILPVRDIVTRFAQRFRTEPLIAGTEQPTAWLSNAHKSHRMFGSPRVSVEQMIEWIADWLQRGGATLDKPTHFEVRDGDY